MKTIAEKIGFAVVCLLLAAGILFPVGAVSAALSPALAAQDVPRFEPGPCMYDLPVPFVEGQDVECGYLIVPEEYDNAGAATLRLAVVILRSLNENPQPDPIVLAQGGPGGSTIYTYLQVFAYNDTLRADRDYILFDQRGTLYSEPDLSCPEFLDLTIETLDDDLTDEEGMQMSLDATRACRERLTAEGANLSAFDSIENARDIESLRVAMGYEQINLYGVSYGTLLAQHALRLNPAGLRSVTLDSVVSTEINFVTNAPQTMNASFEALFAACAQDPGCSRNYPNLREVFYDLVDELNANPVTMTLQDFETFETYPALIDGESFLTGVFQMLYATDLIPHMPRAIYAVRAGDYAFFERIMSVLTFDRSLAYGMYYSVMCAEDADFTAQDYNLENLPPQLVEMEDTSAEGFLQTCQIWDVETLPDTVDDPVQSDVPVLLLSGAFDPITPPQYAEQVAQGLPNSYHYVFPNGGHGALGSGDCQDGIFLDFIGDPATAPDAGCIQSMGGPEFVTPATIVELPVLIKLLNLQDGTSWQSALYLLGLGFLLSALLVYPLVWVVRKLRGTPAPAAAPVVISEPGAAWEAVGSETTRGRGFYRFAPWLAALTGLLLLAFTVILVVILAGMLAENDIRILVGLPGSARPLFVLPLLAALGAVLMVASMLIAWLRGAGSVWGRIYFTLLTFAALVAVAILALWRMVTALF